ncbi:hypothetical protein KDU71_08550 [Carboxylicivirga sediminis]|uniref:Uncharacterized protein n=1 Tax=Carboxylicivirga sediminis TaxID=2006564 RepID=A0A941IWZ8_9BACT|nr:hypothetical protein [Carboxylicivirga sediminis]MBR8535605.1 hypothetical protein [Carboxylicivirga sediminis]
MVLPYHWNNGTYTTHEYCRGQAIYQKEFHLSSDDEMVEHFLFFEGVNSKATVILNGKMLRMCTSSYNDLSSNPYEKIDIWQNGTLLESGLPPVEIVDGQHRLTMPYVVDVDTNRIEQQFAGKELPFSKD